MSIKPAKNEQWWKRKKPVWVEEGVQRRPREGAMDTVRKWPIFFSRIRLGYISLKHKIFALSSSSVIPFLPSFLFLIPPFLFPHCILLCRIPFSFSFLFLLSLSSSSLPFPYDVAVIHEDLVISEGMQHHAARHKTQRSEPYEVGVSVSVRRELYLQTKDIENWCVCVCERSGCCLVAKFKASPGAVPTPAMSTYWETNKN